MAHPSRRENPTLKKPIPTKFFLKNIFLTLLFANLNWIVIVTLFLSFWSNLLHISPTLIIKRQNCYYSMQTIQKKKSRTLYFLWFMKSEQQKRRTKSEVPLCQTKNEQMHSLTLSKKYTSWLKIH